MTRRSGASHVPAGGRLLGLAALSLLLAGCGAASSRPPQHHPASGAGVTIRVASVPGLGMVLVSSAGRTLYTLSSEHDGKLTCTKASGCLQYWPELDLKADQSAAGAGAGVTAQLLGRTAGASGGGLATYGGWPLYTYSGDSAAGQSNGEGVQSYGGTWWAVSASGTPVKARTTSSTPSPSSGAYGY